MSTRPKTSGNTRKFTGVDAHLAYISDSLVYGTLGFPVHSAIAKHGSTTSAEALDAQVFTDGWDPYKHIITKECPRELYFAKPGGAYRRARKGIVKYKKQQQEVLSNEQRALRRLKTFTEEAENLSKIKELVESDKMFPKQLESRLMEKDRTYAIRPYTSAAVFRRTPKNASSAENLLVTESHTPSKLLDETLDILASSSSSSDDEDFAPGQRRSREPEIVRDDAWKIEQSKSYFERVRDASGFGPYVHRADLRPPPARGLVVGIRSYVRECSEANKESGTVTGAKADAFLLGGDNDPFARGFDNEVKIMRAHQEDLKKLGRKKFNTSANSRESLSVGSVGSRSVPRSVSATFGSRDFSSPQSGRGSPISVSRISEGARNLDSTPSPPPFLPTPSALPASYLPSPAPPVSSSALEKEIQARFSNLVEKMGHISRMPPNTEARIRTGKIAGGPSAKIQPTFLVPKAHLLKIVNQSFVMTNFGVGGKDLKRELPSVRLLQLRELNLDGNRLHTDDGISGLLPILQTLTILNISNNGITAADTEKLTHNLKESKCIRTLLLDGNDIRDAGAAAISKFLISNSTLMKLSINNNSIGPSGGEAVALALSQNSTLQNLKIGYNNIRERGAYSICLSVGKSKSLISFSFHWNGLGATGASHISDALVANLTLKKLNISNNRITDVGAMLIGYGLRRNSSLYRLNLDGNPLGYNGGQAVQRHTKIPGGDFRIVTIKGCNLSPSVNTTKFNPIAPKGFYNLDLSVAGDRAIAAELWELSLLQPGTKNFVNETIDGQKIIGIDNPTKNWTIPTRGAFQFEYQWQITSCQEVVDEKQMDKVLDDAKALPVTEQKDFVLSSLRDKLLRAVTATRAVKSMGLSHDRVHMASALFLQLEDVQNGKDEFDKVLSTDEQKAVARKLQSLYNFDATMCNRHWRISLSSTEECALLSQLKNIDAIFKGQIAGKGGGGGKAQVAPIPGERKALSTIAPINTSQLQDCSSFRNITHDGQARDSLSLVENLTAGILEFDFAAPLRPDTTAPDPLSAEDWEKILPDLRLAAKSAWPDAAAEIIKKCGTVTSTQLMEAARLVAGFSRGSMFAEMILRGYQYVSDLDLLWDRLRNQCSRSELLQVVNKCGYLNIWNPEYTEGFLTLNLAMPDERKVTEMLVKMSVKEPGENWLNESLNGVSFELPMSWVEEVPYTGILTLTYACKPEFERRVLRIALRAQTLSTFSKNTLSEGFLGQRILTLPEIISGIRHRRVARYPLWAVERGFIDLALGFVFEAEEESSESAAAVENIPNSETSPDANAPPTEPVPPPAEIRRNSRGQEIILDVDKIEEERGVVSQTYLGSNPKRATALKGLANIPGILATKTDAFFYTSGVLHIAIMNAEVFPVDDKNMPSPYVVVELQKKEETVHERKTDYDFATLNPEWKTTIEFPLPANDCIFDYRIVIKIWDREKNR